MVGSLLAASAAMALAQSVEHGRVTESDRPIATLAPYPANMVDSVRRPGFNGRLFVGRPIIGGIDAYPLGWDSPGPEYYGAFDNQEALVYSRTGLITISMNPWEEIRPENLRALREAQQFWLKEQGYIGGVRTHVNDLYTWKREGGLAMAEPTEPAAKPQGLPEPRLIFEVPADMPRVKSRIKVEARPARSGPEAIVVLSKEPVTISWPMNAPANTVVRAEAREATTKTASR